MKTTLNFSIALILLWTIQILYVRGDTNNNRSYVKEACSVTLYQDLCINSMASYSKALKLSPRRWARVGVSITIREVKLVSQHLNNLKTHSHIRGRENREALSECVECIQDSLDNLHDSLRVLRSLSVVGFDEQMNDVLTWLSAALTDQDTCIDGVQGRTGLLFARFCDQLQNASYVTSNALAFANKLATSGFHHDLGDH